MKEFNNSFIKSHISTFRDFKCDGCERNKYSYTLWLGYINEKKNWCIFLDFFFFLVLCHSSFFLLKKIGMSNLFFSIYSKFYFWTWALIFNKIIHKVMLTMKCFWWSTYSCFSLPIGKQAVPTKDKYAFLQWTIFTSISVYYLRVVSVYVHQNTWTTVFIAAIKYS